MLHFFDSLRRSLTRDDPSGFAAPGQFGPFRVLHQVGVGALGPVFRTYEPDRDRLVAVKVFRIDITPEQARSLADELSRVASSGLFHPSIVEPIAAGVEGSAAYNAEEYVAAESLDVAMRHDAPASIDTVLPFITQLAGAIDFARAAGIGHGALHPRDIFITPDEARVTGFGVVDALERVGFRAPVRRPYSPPERIEGEPWSTEADVFSLAAITYELLTARRPSGLGSEIGPLTPGTAEASASALHAVLARAMHEDPSRRYSTALAFASDLEDAANGLAISDASSAAVTDGARESSQRAPGASAMGAASVPSILDLHDLPTSERRPPAGIESDDEEELDDVSAERDEDEAHHQLALAELSESPGREPERVDAIVRDEDSEVEAEADRYAGDDFLLDAAGAASSQEAYDAFRAHDDDEVVARRIERDESVEYDERAEDDQRIEPVIAARDSWQRDDTPAVPYPDLEPHRDVEAPAAVRSSTPPPTFGQYAADSPEPAERSSSRWLLAVTLVLGLAVGFAGGYALWGRSGLPAPGSGREFSEQAVTPSPSDPGRSRGAAQAPATPSSKPAATSDSPTKPPAQPASPSPPPPVVTEPGADAARTPSSGAAAKSAPPAARKPNGTIVVRSTPSGAGVTLNGRWRGRTPLAIENLALTKYDVRVVQPGYVAEQQAVTLSARDPDRTVTIRLEREAGAGAAGRQSEPSRGSPPSGSAAMTGTIFVDSRPRGAKVFIDSKEVGTTPLSLPDVRIGSHVVRLELPDHRTWTSTASVAAGQQTRVTGSLERIQ